MLKKCIDSVHRSLTARIFLTTALILLIACGVTYAFVVWATPISYISIANSELDVQLQALTEKLEQTTLEECGPIIDRFIMDTGAEVIVLNEEGNSVTLPTSVQIRTAYENTESVTVTGDYSEFKSGNIGNFVLQSCNITVCGNGKDFPFMFKDSDTAYTLTAFATVTAVNQTIEALGRVLPLLIVVVLVTSLLGALFYSRYITKPIVRLSGISQKMAALDFKWECPEQRKDEIGVLGQNLNELSRRLSASLSELQTANTALRQDIDRERELERQRMTFFSAASHELKTPITVLKGQISGMLAGVDIYQNRDKYLARSLVVTGRMEKLVQEMLVITRMENAGFAIRWESVDLYSVVNAQLEQAADLAKQRKQKLVVNLAKNQWVTGDSALLSRAVSNLVVNAMVYSPEKATISVRLSALENGLELTVENSGVLIPKEALPHLFEAFYRVEGSRSRETGGSGLGLYLVKMIMERHQAHCNIINTENGVKTTISF